MADISAKDVKALRDATGAGMMDAKRALKENDGDNEAAAMAARAGPRQGRRAGRPGHAEGAVASPSPPPAGRRPGPAPVGDRLRGQVARVRRPGRRSWPAAVAAEGEGAIDERRRHRRPQVTLKENIELGRVVRFEAAEGNVLDTYLHVQNGRGVNGVLVELEGGTAELAHDIAVHIAFGKPGYLNRDEVPAEAVEAERAALEAETRNEGKPEAAMPKIVEGKLNGWFKRVPGGVLLDQPYAKDDKQTVTQLLGGAKVVRFAQVLIGD